VIARLFLASLVAAVLAACPGGGAQKPTGPTVATGNQAPVAKLVPGTIADLVGEVIDIEVAGLSGDRAAAAKQSLATRVGAAFAVANVADDIRTLWKIAGVADVQVSGRVVGRGIAVRYTIRDLPKVSSIEVHGATAIATDEIIGDMPARRGYPIDPGAFNNYKQVLLERYRELGFAHATIEWTTNRKKDGADVVFTIVEGAPVEIAKIELRGLKAVKRQTLIDLIAKDGGPAIGGRYWELSVERALLYITSHYYDLGYIEAHIDEPVIKPSADGASVEIVIPITEGAQYKLGKLTVKGTLAATEAEYLKKAGVKTGEVFSRRKLNEAMDRLRDFHAASGGRANASVFPVSETDTKKHRIDVTFEVE
jgi:outer membrane protein insertion porin family